MQIKPNSAEIYSNLGNTLHEKRELEQAIQAYDKAIKIQPDYAKAHSNLGITLLLKGDFQLGWQEYEWRLKCRDPQAEKRRFFNHFGMDLPSTEKLYFCMPNRDLVTLFNLFDMLICCLSMMVASLSSVNLSC